VHGAQAIPFWLGEAARPPVIDSRSRCRLRADVAGTYAPRS